jgi:rRNA maturation endonuclease Nob1
MSDVRRCLGCSATYPADEHACPTCGSHAADVEEQAAERDQANRKPARRRKA